jgi:hypothetical protein
MAGMAAMAAIASGCIPALRRWITLTIPRLTSWMAALAGLVGLVAVVGHLVLVEQVTPLAAMVRLAVVEAEEAAGAMALRWGCT